MRDIGQPRMGDGILLSKMERKRTNVSVLSP